jgi:ribonuclease Z
MMRVVVLGTTASLPTKDSLPFCLAVKFGSVLLFDACEGVQQQFMKFDVSFVKVKCIFLSHLHADHFLGIFGLVESMNMNARTEELRIIGPVGTKKFLETFFSLPQLKPKFPIKIIEAKGSKRVFKDELLEVRAFRTKHSAHSIGYAVEEHPLKKFDLQKCEEKEIPRRMLNELHERGEIKLPSGKKVKLEEVTFLKKGRKLVFSGDTMPCQGLSKNAKDSDLLVHDCTFSDEEKDLAKEKKHSTAKQAGECAKKAGAKQLLLGHFSNRYKDRNKLLEEAKKEFGNSILAQEGLELLI